MIIWGMDRTGPVRTPRRHQEDVRMTAQIAPTSGTAERDARAINTRHSEIAPGETVDSSVSANATAFSKLAQAYTIVSEFTGSVRQ